MSAPRKRAVPARSGPAAKPATVLVMRTCDASMRSHGGFVWPKSGPVECPDWNSEPVCGGGLHGLLWGEGDGSLVNHDRSANWLVVEVIASEVVDLDRKVKFPRGTIVFCGSAFEATKYIAERAPNSVKAIVGGTSTSGDRGTSTSGDGGTSTSGDGGEIRIRWWDDKSIRYRTAVGHIGEDGLLAGIAYCCREGKFFRKDGQR